MRVDRRPMWSTVPEMSAHLQKVSGGDRLIEDERRTGNDVLERFLRCERDGNATDAEAGQRRCRVDAEMAQRRQDPDEDDEEIDASARDVHERFRCASTGPRKRPDDVGLDLGDEEHHDPDDRRDADEDGGVRSELPDHERQRQAAQQPSCRGRDQKQPDRRWQDAPLEYPRFLEHSSPQPGDGRSEEPVENNRDEIEHRDREQDDEPFEDPHPTDFRAGQEARQRPLGESERHFAVERRHGIQRRGREEPDRRRVRSRHSLQDDVDRTVGGCDHSYDFLVRLERIRARPVGRIADLRQPRGEARVEDHKELVCECRRGLTFEPRREVLRGDLVLPFPRGGEEAEHAPSRRVATERVLRCRCGRRGRRRRRCRSLAPDHGCAHERAGQADAKRAPEGVRGESHDVTTVRRMCRPWEPWDVSFHRGVRASTPKSRSQSGIPDARSRKTAFMAAAPCGNNYACKALATPRSPRAHGNRTAIRGDGGAVPRRLGTSRHVTSQLRAADRL